LRKPAVEKREASGVVNTDTQISRATTLARLAPAGVEGEHSDEQAIALANKIMDLVSPELAEEILAEHWLPRCDFGHDGVDPEEWLHRKVKSAARTRQNGVGCDRASAVPEWAEEEEISEEEAHLALERLRTGQITIRLSEGDDGAGYVGLDLLDPGSRAAFKTWLGAMEDRSSPAFWRMAKFPPRQSLFGGLLYSGSRMWMAAPTGKGKTHFAMAIGGSVAAGKDFLYWHTPAPKRVLYIDGEMPRALMQQRFNEMAERMQMTPEEAAAFDRNFHMLNYELASFEPLNTPGGQAKIEQWIKDHNGVDLVVFDNVQSLCIGEIDAEQWEAIKPWSLSLQSRDIAQLWLHHTNDQGKSFGDKSRLWTMETVVILQVPEGDLDEVRFTPDFSQKARERTPANRADYRRAEISLSGGRWSYVDQPTKAQENAMKVLSQVGEIRKVLTERSMKLPVTDTDLALIMSGAAPGTPKANWSPEVQKIWRRLRSYHKGEAGRAAMASVGRLIGATWHCHFGSTRATRWTMASKLLMSSCHACRGYSTPGTSASGTVAVTCRRHAPAQWHQLVSGGSRGVISSSYTLGLTAHAGPCRGMPDGIPIVPPRWLHAATAIGSITADVL
jgi:hypothetical protein